MRAALCKSYGPPKSLVIEEIESPNPGPDQLLVNVEACGINFPDVLLMAGKYQVRPDLPFSPGGEISGNVADLGETVKGYAVGERVLALTGFGGLAEQVAVPARQALRIPDSMETVTAAGFTMTYGTSYYALKQRAGLQPGETLLVLGAAGGVGLAAVELGKLLGARVIAAASNAEKLRLARDFGADETIDYSDSSLKESVRQLTNGRGVDVIFDPVGGELFDECMRSVAWRGRVLVVGFAAGEIPRVPTNLALLKGCSIIGVFWGRFTELEPDAHAENMQELLGLHGAGKINPYVSKVFDLDHAGDAIDALARRLAKGKIVVKIS